MSRPIDAAARPLPSEDTTPPVMKMYLVGTLLSSSGAKDLVDHPNVGRGVDFVVHAARWQPTHRAAALQRAQLLQTFNRLQQARFRGRELQQEAAPVGVQTDLTKPRSRPPRPGARRHVGDGAPGE